MASLSRLRRTWIPPMRYRASGRRCFLYSSSKVFAGEVELAVAQVGTAEQVLGLVEAVVFGGVSR